MLNNKSIRTQLVVRFGGLVISSIIVFAVFSYFYAKKMHLHNIYHSLENLTQEKANKMDIFLQSSARIPRVMAAAVESDLSKDETKLKELIRKALRDSSDIYGIAVVFKPYSFYPEQRSFTPYWWYNNGKPDYIQHVPDDYIYWEDDWYTVPRDTGNVFWSEPYYDEGGGESLMVTHSIPFYDGEEEFLGVTTVDISLSYINEVLKQLTHSKELGPNAHAMLINDNGKVLGIDDPKLLDQPVKNLQDQDLLSLNDGELKFLFQSVSKNEKGILLIDNPFRGLKRVYLAHTNLMNSRWKLLVFVEENFVLKDIYNLRIVLSLFVFFLIVVSFVLIRVVAGSITNPLKELTEHVSNFTGADFNPALGASSIEITKLVDSFVSMNDRITENILGLENEIKERVKAEKDLELFKSAVDASADAVGMSSPEGKHWYQNESFNVLFGEIGDNPPATIYVDHDIGKSVFQSIMNGKSWVGEVKMYGRNRKILDIFLRAYTVFGKDGEIVGLVGVHTDITELKHSQALMVQTEKMMSVGGLAAGMAHEINNPLSAILQTIDVMNKRLILDIKNSKNIDAAKKVGTSVEAIKAFMIERRMDKMFAGITESGQRIANIVDNMLNFSRNSDGRRVKVDLADLIDHSIELAGIDYNLRKNYDFKEIKIIKEYQECIPCLMCEEGKIQQVLLNILKNGAQVMNDGQCEKPYFIIRIKYTKKTEIFTIEIEDNGPGMPEQVRKRIFEPFYTTKAPGEGTGLGLSVSYFIVTENHNGKIYVESEPGKGAKFTITLPRHILI